MNQKHKDNQKTAYPDTSGMCYRTAMIRSKDIKPLKAITLCLMLFLLYISPAKAGWLTYGNGYDGPLLVSGPTYTDNVRYSVTNFSNSSSGSYINTLTITIGTGYGTFLLNDRILIVDMAASCSNRNYELAIITGISGSTITATSAVTNSATVHISSGSQTLTQVLRIPQWTNVSFNTSSDVLSCHAWEPSTGTGGILAFNCNGTLDLSTGGTINTVNLGAAGISAHAGGVHGSASLVPLTGGLGGLNPGDNGTDASAGVIGHVSNGNGGLGITTSCSSNPIYGGNGGCGDHAIDGTGPFPGTRTYSFYPSDHTKLLFNIGNAGLAGQSGQGAGAGGNGGGGGAGAYGRGSSSPNCTNGGQGANPTGNPNGGQGGDGGNGGGSVYIKAYYVSGPGGSTKVIISHGSIAGNGVQKTGMDRAGNGGNGGNGADGGCSSGTFYAAGGGGGYGEGGNGPDGGAGGDGGNGGAIWIDYNNATSFSLSNLDASGGTGGNGGAGGLKGSNGTQGIDGGTGGLNCSSTCGSCSFTQWLEAYPYGSPSGCNYDNCMCDDAFRVLADMTSHSVSGSDVYYSSPATGNSKNYCIKNSTGLWSYEYVVNTAGSCSTPGSATLNVYHCPLTNCTLPFWTNIAPNTGSVSLPTITWFGAGVYSSNVITDQNRQSCTANCGGIGNTHTGGVGGSGYPGFIYSSPPPGGRPRDGLPGANGNNGQDGDVHVAASVPSNDLSGDPSKPVELSDIKNDISSDIRELTIQPNPASSYLNYSFNSISNNSYSVSIVDITGREVYKKDFKATTGSNSQRIDIRSFAAGNYVISFSCNGNKQQIKFVKE